MTTTRPASSFIDYLVHNDLVSEMQAKALRAAAAKERALLGTLLLRHKVLSVRQMLALLREQASMPGVRLGDLAVDRGFANRDDVERIAKLQAESHVDPIDLLLRYDVVDHDALFEALIQYVRIVERGGTKPNAASAA